mmetsp:Transcript_120593/g.240129  ORF Transcript_120593/g.240129 Transcript_120593/m.240129 type:complete len:205 (+) Transcript_120593:80-694(+)
MSIAAVSAARRQRQRREKLEQARRKQSEEDKRKVKIWFRAFDTNQSGQLEAEQLKELLASKFPESPPSDTDISNIITFAKKEAGQSGKVIVTDPNAVGQDAAILAVAHYINYLEASKALNALMEKHDVSKSGQLEREELRQLMVEYAQDDVTVEEEDVDYILEQCDQSKSGGIRVEELLPAIASWNQIAATKEQAQKSKACILL